MLDNFSCFGCGLRTFLHIFSLKTSVRNTIRMSNSLDPDSVGPDLGPNCLQRLSADTEVAASKKRVKIVIKIAMMSSLATVDQHNLLP